MYIADDTSTEIKEKLNPSTPVILPIGAVEAHGAHLPLGIDNDLAESYAKKVAEKTGSLILPNIPYGQVWSLRDFPGSITVSNDTLIRMLVEIAESLYAQDVRMVIFLTAHYGNMNALKDASRVLYDKYPDLKTVYLFYPNLNQYADEVREGEKVHGSYVHADEIETSIALHLTEEKVDMEKAIDDTPNIHIRADFTPTPWGEFTQTAVLGDATLASKEKGKYIIEKTLADAVKIINEIRGEMS